MEELRNIQKEKVKNAEKLGELKERIKQINKISKEIENIKRNEPIKLDEDTLETSLKGRPAKFLKKYKIPIITTALQALFGVLGIVTTSLGIANQLKKGAKKIGEIGEMIEKTGKIIKKTQKPWTTCESIQLKH